MDDGEPPLFTPDGAGSRLRLKVSAGASRRKVAGAHAGALKLSVTTAPEKGKANRDVLSLVGETFGIAPAEIELLRGETAPEKLIRLPLAPDEALRRWNGFLASSQGRAGR